MENRRDLSLRLSNVLNMVGASEKMKRLHRRKATEFVTLDTFNYTGKREVISYICGSWYEGTVTSSLKSDRDLIYCYMTPPIVLYCSMAARTCSLLMVRDSWTFPGYVKLQLLFDGRPMAIDCLEFDKCSSIDQLGRNCYKHPPRENMPGPALVLLDRDGRHIFDIVPAYKCNGIPLWATEWITRERRHGWPSQQQLDDMRIMGCMVVQVGYYNSLEKEVEWRLSFSLQERRLMESLNAVQHKVYILMKMIKQDILETRLNEESLSSYHCKTCVFYMAENNPPDMWTDDNLINCLIECLKLLLSWIRHKNCPSYFIKEQNLFDKEGFHRLLEPLEWLLHQLLQKGHYFLNLLNIDRVGEMLRGGDLQAYRHISDVLVNYAAYVLTNDILLFIGHTYRRILSASKRKKDILSFFISNLDITQHQTRIPGQKALLYIQPWLHLHIGMEYAARAFTCVYKPACKELMKRADHHLNLARKTETVKSRLVQASVLFRSQTFEECSLLLQEIENIWTFPVINECACCTRKDTMFVPMQPLYDFLPSMQNISVTKLLRKYLSFCVIFLPSQAELAPPPLQYEMWRSLGTPPGSRDETEDAWFDWAVVDAKVYMIFLQYLVYVKLDRESQKQMAISNLALFLQKTDTYLYHKETAYNLLGWIFLQEHNVADALKCFIKSWQIRPFHNAVKFHVLNIYSRLVGSQPPP